jgi:hypothetical protein
VSLAPVIAISEALAWRSRSVLGIGCFAFGTPGANTAAQSKYVAVLGKRIITDSLNLGLLTRIAATGSVALCAPRKADCAVVTGISDSIL